MHSNQLCAGYFAALLLAAACSGNGEPTAASDPLATQAGFCQALGTALCNGAVVTACYGSSDATLAADTQKCVTGFQEPAHCNPQGLPYHEAGAQACIDAASATYANARLTADSLAGYQQACLGALSKLGGQGSHCGADSDCDGSAGLRCVIRTGATSGTCQVPVEAMPGSSCAAPAAECQTGYYCDSDQNCGQLRSAGQSCDPLQKPCDPSSACSGNVCVKKKDDGQACAAASECAGGFCIEATGASMGVCSATLALAITTAGSCDAFKP